MKMIKNITIALLVSYCAWVMTMNVELGMLPSNWNELTLSEKIKAIAEEKEAALSRFRSAVGKAGMQEDARKAAADATKLDNLHDTLLIEKSKEKISDYEKNLENIRRKLSEFQLSRALSNGPSREQLEQDRLSIQIALEQEIAHLRKLQNPNAEYE